MCWDQLSREFGEGGGKSPDFALFADVHGINTLIIAAFKFKTGLQNS